MIEFFIGCTAAYIFFRFLDYLFGARRLPRNQFHEIREGDFVKEIDGQFWIVREHEVLPEKIEPPTQQRPDLKVVK
jgi:hypothetical protein